MPSGIRGFTITTYGQDRLAMDWFGLTDPFTQVAPIKVSNAYSGTLWFQGQLVNPRSGYYNYSGVQLGSVNSGATSVLNMTWDVGVSGWIVSSSPVTDSGMTLALYAFTSSNYTGAYSSGSVAITNTVFNRYSGVIKIFGDDYAGDKPRASLALSTGGTFVSGSTYAYAVSYIRSGWESDIGTDTNLQVTSGYNAITVSWSLVPGVTQYCLYRWSGTRDQNYSAANSGFTGLIDLIYISGPNSFGDTNVAAVRAGLFRHQNWQTAVSVLTVCPTDTTNYLSPPHSRKIDPTTLGIGLNQTWQGIMAHSWLLSRNLSGTSLLGPWYVTFNEKWATSIAMQFSGLGLSTGVDGLVSGGSVADSQITSGMTIGQWYRWTLYLSGLSSSGTATLQFYLDGVGNNNQTATSGFNVDDVYIVAVS